MKNSFIKKIVTIAEWEKVAKDIIDLFSQDDDLGHSNKLKHDGELITKCFSHESLLIWNTHVWGHFNGEKWDGIFMGSIRKSEKFGKKFMDEYLWLSKNSNKGISLYRTAEEYALDHGCEYISMNVTELHPKSNKIKRLYLKMGYEKDSETYVKKISNS